MLPDEVGGVTGFAHCGHVVHFNLKEHHLPYKELIGQVFLDKIPSAKTIVNKTAEIHHVYRNFEFEVYQSLVVEKLKESVKLLEFASFCSSLISTAANFDSS